MCSPRISVVLPCHNMERFLTEAVQSILAQSFGDFELLAVDDGSTDRTAAILNEFAESDDRVRIISLQKSGMVSALNAGIDAARGEFIARMDADDVALIDRFEKQLAALDDNPQLVAIGSATLHIDAEGDPIRSDHWAERHEEIDELLLQGAGGIAHPTAMIQIEALRQVGGYRNDFLWIEDKDLWLRLAEVGELANLPDVLLAYRLHNQSVCATRARDQAANLKLLLADAYRRRGITREVPHVSIPRRGSTAQARQAKWVRAALRAGHKTTAIKHSEALLRSHPWHPLAWQCWLKTQLYAQRDAA